MERHIQVPFGREEAEKLKAGDYIYLTGTIYTARDAAHKRMQEALDKGEELPFSVEGNVIYYMGPERDVPSVPQVLLRQAVWTNIRLPFLIWV